MTSDVLETKTPEAVRWSALPERGTLPSLRLLAWIATRIGRWAGRLLLYPITSYFVFTACAARRTSYEYLKQIRGYPAHWWNVFRHFHCFAATILDRLTCCAGSSSVLTWSFTAKKSFTTGWKAERVASFWVHIWVASRCCALWA